jgi:hypothetical protein
MRYIQLILPLILLGFASGCAGGLGFQGMSADQITAAVKDKNASVVCVSGKYAGASVNSLFINTDKGVPVGVSIDVDCKATFQSMPYPPGVKSNILPTQ